MVAPGIDVVPIKRSELDRAQTVIASAFVDEPGAMAVIRRSPEVRLRILRRHHAMRLGMLDLPHDTCRCAMLNGELVGVMIVSAPGEMSVTTGIIFKALLRMLLHVSPAIMWRGLLSSLDDENHRPAEPHYYLETIAVDPKCQGSGVGTALLSSLTELADEEGMLIHLGTTNPRTLPLYKRHGFKVVAESKQSGVPNYHMQREPGGAHNDGI